MTDYRSNHAGISLIVWLFTLALVTGSSRALDVTPVPSPYACRPAVMAASPWLHVHSQLPTGLAADGNLFISTKRGNGRPQNRPVSIALALSRGGASSRSDTPRASGVLSYYVLWSPGVFKKTIYSLIALMVLRLASTPFQNHLAVLVEKAISYSPLGFILQIVVLPLLSSACCGIQLVINALVGAGGCAGFNKYLGPLRPCFLALLFSVTATSFPYHQSRSMVIRWTRYSLLRLFVALMPEMVHLWNVHCTGSIQRHADNDHEADKLFTTIEMTIPSMGCVACINKIDASMRRCAPDQIEEAKSWLEPSGKGGRALVRAVASTEQEAERLAQSLVDAVRDAGFQTCSLDSIRIEHDADLEQ